MANTAQSFDDPDGGDGFFTVPEDFYNWFTIPPPNPPRVRSIHEWQEKYTREVQVALLFWNRNTKNEKLRIKVGPKEYSVRFSIIGGTTYPRFLIRLVLNHPNGPQHNVTLRIVFPVYGDDGESRSLHETMQKGPLC
jgi:hypothetical protein